MPLVFSYGPEEIRRVAVCSGGAAEGSPRPSPGATTASSRARRPSRRSTPRRRPGIHFVAAGHYATETSGVRLLAERVGRELGVEWEFVDLPNPV